MDFKDSQTYKNLNSAFLAELQAASKYRMYSDKAKEEKFLHISNVFGKNSKNELEHAKLWYKLMRGGKEGTTIDNLKSAAAKEKYEWMEMYKKFARTARREGYEQIARLFDGVGSVEFNHNNELNELVRDFEQNNMFCQNEEKIWVCNNCGSIYKGKCAPQKCPVCGYPQGYFELL